MPIQHIIELLVCALVDESDAVVVTAEAQTQQTTFRVQVSPGDVGKLIGKQGRTARSLRTLLGAASVKDNHRYLLDIVEAR